MAKNTLLKQDDFGPPAWITAMRDAIGEAISADDIKDIVKDQVGRAKKGDREAIRFIFGDTLATSTKGGTFIQNNFHGAESPAQPAKSKPGTQDRIALMQQRAAAGL